MPKLNKDLQKFVIVAAAVGGITVFLWQRSLNCIQTMFSIVENQLFVEEEEEEEDDDEQDLLIRLGDRKDLEEEKIRSIVKNLLNGF